jgi:hypothetical protein
MDARLVSAHDLEQISQLLELIGRVLQEPAAPKRRRGWVLDYCQRTDAPETQLWDLLARYRQQGPAALMSWRTPRRSVVQVQAHQVREVILQRLVSAPRAVLDCFCQLTRLLGLLNDRLQYLCDCSLQRFLDPDPGWLPELYDQELCLGVLIDQVHKELEGLEDLLSEPHELEELVTDYHDRVLKRVLVDEGADDESF